MNKRYAALTLIALALVAAGAAPAQTLVISPDPITLTAQAGGSSVQTSVSFTSSDNGATTISFTVVPSVSWISVPTAPSGGWKTPTTVVVTVSPPSTLPSGLNTATLSIYSTQFQSVPVNVMVSTVSVTPTSVSWSYLAGSTTYPGPSTLTIAGANGSFSLSKPSADTWYTAAAYGNPLSNVLVQFNSAVASSLSPGTYASTLTITPGGANPIPVTVAVTLTVNASPQVTVSPASLVFNWQSGGTNNQTQQNITLTTNATQAITAYVTNPSISWISLPGSSITIPAGGSTQATITVSGLGLGQGSYSGTVQVTIASGALFPNGTTTLTVPIQLNVSVFPVLYVSPGQLTFSYQFGGATPSFQSVTPTSSGGTTQPMSYNVSVSPAASWLTVPSGTLATSGGSFPVSVSPAGLSPGNYSSNVIVTPVADGSGQTAISIPVALSVTFGNTLQVSTQGQPLVFPYEAGQAAPANQTVSIYSTTGAPLNYSVTWSAAWLVVAGCTADCVTDQTTITVGINTAGIPSPPQNPYNDATIAIAATDPTTGNAVNTQSIDVRLYASSTAQLVVTPAGPLQFYTYPSASGPEPGSPSYPLSNTATLSLSSTSSATSDVLTITGVTRTVANQATIGDWLGGTSPAAQTPASFTVNGTLNNSTMPTGSYSGTLAISATNSAGTAVADSPVSIPVTFVVDSAKGTVSPSSLTFNQIKGGSAPASQTVQVTTDGSSSLGFDPVVNTGLVNWLTVSSISGPTPGSFSVAANAANLTTGTYSGAVYVTVPNAYGSPFRIPVTFNVAGGAIAAAPSSLSFTQAAGGSAPAPQTVQVTFSPSTSSANFTVSAATTTPANGTWLAAAITAGGGSTPGTVTVTVTPGSLTAGTYTGSVVITSAGAAGSPITIPVTLTIGQPTITAPTTQLTFSQLAGGAAPAAQSVAVTSSPGPISFGVSASTTSGGNWLTVTAGSSGTTGTTPGTVQVSVNGSSLGAGSYNGTVTITSAGATGSPITIPVVLNVSTAAVLSATPQALTFSAAVGQATTPQTVQLTSTIAAPFTVTTTPSGTWLSVSPSSGTASPTAVALTVSASTASLAAGSYSGTVTISSAGALNPLTINVSLTVATVPTPVVSNIENAASNQITGVSPGENIVLYGTGIGPATLVQVTQLTSDGKFPTTLGNTQVLFDGVAAPIYYASSKQTSVFVPYGVGGRASTSVQVVYSGAPSAAVPYNVAQAVPGIYTLNFSGAGPGAILNSDNTVNGPNNPAAKGTEVQIFMTGEGATTPAGTDGAIAGTAGYPLAKPILGPVTATVAGLTATVDYAGSAPGAIYGFMQVNIHIPANAPSGAQPLVINIGSFATQAGVTIAVQ